MAGTVGAGQGGVLMEPDTAPRPLDAVERAHLRAPGDASHVMYRYDVAPRFAGLLERFWIPVWSVPPGREAPQHVLQYPVTLLVVSGDYARDRKSTRLNSSHANISYAVFCLKKKKKHIAMVT